VAFDAGGENDTFTEEKFQFRMERNNNGKREKKRADKTKLFIKLIEISCNLCGSTFFLIIGIPKRYYANESKRAPIYLAIECTAECGEEGNQRPYTLYGCWSFRRKQWQNN